MDKKKMFSRKVITAVILGIIGVISALGYTLPEEQIQPIIDVVSLLLGLFV